MIVVVEMEIAAKWLYEGGWCFEVFNNGKVVKSKI